MLCCGYTLTDFPISIRLTSLALWQSNDCPSASKATLMNMDKYFVRIHYERLRNHNKATHNKTVCIFLGIYCTWPQWIGHAYAQRQLQEETRNISDLGYDATYIIGLTGTFSIPCVIYISARGIQTKAILIKLLIRRSYRLRFFITYYKKKYLAKPMRSSHNASCIEALYKCSR